MRKENVGAMQGEGGAKKMLEGPRKGSSILISFNPPLSFPSELT